ncbi:MAG: FAD-binding protein, partial [Nitrospirae bacterium]
IDLILEDDRCIGATVLRRDKIFIIYAKAVVLATGGACQIYSRTTNPQIATGDGMAIAYRAGALLENMEFVQFHPTSLYCPSAPPFLLSEAMRGEGGILRNIKGERFMKKYHEDGELAPRDVVSRAIISEMVETGSNYVYLDMRHLDKEFLKRRFPRIYNTCLQYDIDITEDLIPVSPAAHYMMGGVKTDIDCRTSIDGLFAAGEVACTGVHGANRLASNSLLEGLVFGARAGRSCIEYVEEHLEVKRSKHTPSIVNTLSSFDAEKIRQSLKRLMWNRVGIIRCGDSLMEAKEKLNDWSFILKDLELRRRSLELRNMIIVSMLVTEAALTRKGSIGAHYRSDFKQKSELYYIDLRKSEHWDEGDYWPEVSIEKKLR